MTEVREICEDEVRDLFAQVMRDWNFAPYRRGEVRLPVRGEVSARLRDSRYQCPRHAIQLAPEGRTNSVLQLT